MTIAIQSLGTFQLHFPEDDWTGNFNCYDVARSRTTEAGPYEELYTSCFARAGFLIPARTAYNVSGLSLELTINRVTEVAIDFATTTPAGVTEAFNDSMPSVLQAVRAASGAIFVETIDVGFDATILATASDAWTNLGMTRLYFYGSSSYPPLIPNQSTYLFYDPSAENDWYYRTRYRNRQSGEVSALSPATVAAVNIGVSPDALIRGDIYVTDPAGKPLENVLIMLDVEMDVTKPGMVPGQLKKFTDSNGYAFFQVRRGVVATLGIAGTGILRKIQVPIVGTDFDLDDNSLSIAPDAYAVQVPTTRVGERRSM